MPEFLHVCYDMEPRQRRKNHPTPSRRALPTTQHQPASPTRQGLALTPAPEGEINIMAYTNDEKWALLDQIDQLDTNYFGLINDHRHIEAGQAAEGKNLIEQTVAYNATVACTFLDLLDRRDESIRCNDQFAYHHVDEAANLLRSIYPQLPADHVPVPDDHRCHEPDAGPLPF